MGLTREARVLGGTKSASVELAAIGVAGSNAVEAEVAERREIGGIKWDRS